MTTAANPSTVGPKAASGPSSSAHVSRTHGAATGASDTAGADTGFLAILGAVEDISTDLPLGDTGTSALPPDATTVFGVALPTTTPFDATSMLQQNPQIAAAQAQQAADAAMATATNASAAVAANAASVAGASFVSAALSARGLSQPVLPAVASSGAQAAAAPQPGDAASASATPSAPRSPQAAQAADAAGKATTAARFAANLAAGATPAQPGQAESSTQGLQQAFARLLAGKDAAQSGSVSSAADSAKPAPGADPNQWMGSLEQAKATSGPNTPEPVLAPLLFKLEKSQAERGRGGADVKRAEPTYAGTTLGASLPEVSQSGSAAPVLAPEMQVAEQVSYWVSHNVQNAELSLDGLGQSPVQVSISLQGNEAQISFRTDEAAAREVLQNAGAHLKDLLHSEGLILTGVSVGGSGSGNADGSERRPRQNVRQTAIAPLLTSSSDARPGLRTGSLGSSGRTVDLFV